MHRRNKISMDAYLYSVRWPLLKAMDEFLAFGRGLEGQLLFTGDWRFARTDAEARVDGGMNPVAEPEAYLEYLRAEFARKEAEFGDLGMMDKDYALVLPHAYASGDKSEPFYYDQLRYEGGIARPYSDRLTYAPYVKRPVRLMDLAGWARMTELVVAWRAPRYIWFDAYMYELEGRIYKHRAWGGWLGWFPHVIDPATMPDHVRLIPVGHGTLVASQEEMLDSEDPAALARAQATEQALVDLDILPTQDALAKPLAPPL